ncbi:MAG: glycosyltransferase 87 family protein [Candidatus Tumulicola sp.]
MRSRFWAAATVTFACSIAIGVQAALVAHTGFLTEDFRAFYCAARVASQGADPYHTQPLRTCEIANGQRGVFENVAVTVPAPLPGYAIGAFIPFSRLPFPLAARLWVALGLLAWIACMVTLVRFAGVSWLTALAALVLSLGAASIPLGEIVPPAIAAICACAYFAWRGRAWAAALAAAAAMIEPHLGLPVCVALALWSPPTRLPLGISFAVLAGASLLTLGPATNLEYFTSVLPAHALSEAARDTQFSLTSVLASLGIGDAAAIRAGSLWYLGMLAGGTIFAGRLAKKFRNGAFLACVPPAFAVFGGTFIHVTQIAASVPAAVLFIGYVKPERRALAVVALLLLAVPWITAWSPVMGLAPAFPIGYLAWRYWNGNVRAVLIAAAAAFVLIVGLNRALLSAAATDHASARSHERSSINPDLAEASWSEFARKSSTGNAAAWIVRIPTWAGLAFLLVLLIGDADVRRSAALPSVAPS